MKKKTYRTFCADFETTVYKGQEHTEVWASASVELFENDEPKIFHSIQEQLDYFVSLDSHVIAYYHNLKFDGSFWLDYLLTQLKYKQAYEKVGDTVQWLDEKEMKSKSFKYIISDKGQWYSIIIKIGTHFIELRDSLKLLPFSVKEVGKAFKTEHQKLDMEYTGYRYAGCEITESEIEYIKNDVLVMKEAMEQMFNEGHTEMTIGSCCLKEYKNIMGDDYDEFFPDMYQFEIDERKHKYFNAGDWIRKSYKGGWCYLVKGKENKVYQKGTTADVNSLYPSVMHSESGNRYPVGMPHFWTGNIIPDEAIHPERYYFVRVKTRFDLRPGYLPFIQIKGSHLYKGTEALETSDVFIYGVPHKFMQTETGEVVDTRVELTFTMTDFILFKEHYQVSDFEILDGCWFYSELGIFDNYINKYKKIKIESKGGKRTLAKLFLNNLYGKMASSMDSSFKLAYVKPNGVVGFDTVFAQDKKPGYIPVGSAITSYAREFTIRGAQKNFHGVDKPGFIYADTDSVHCDLEPKDIVGLPIHDSDFCHWKLEGQWDYAVFARQKTYIEHVTMEDSEAVEPYYSIKCAGMPARCKNLFELSMKNELSEDELNELKKQGQEAEEFVNIKKTLEDFKVGLKVPGKLMPRRISGGIILKDTYYEMR